MGKEAHDIATLLSCDYCSNNLSEGHWEGHFEGDHEYVFQSCDNPECCKEKWIKVDLGGFDPRDWHKRIDSEVVPAVDKKVYERE